VLEAQATELQVDDGVLVVAGDGYQQRQPRQDYFTAAHIRCMSTYLSRPLSSFLLSLSFLDGGVDD
jgi:hypothetical protein